MSDRMRLFILLALCFLASCSKDDEIPDTDQTGWKAVVTTGETLEAERRYHTIGLETEGLAPGNVIGISTDAEWLTIKSDTLPSDGLFDVLPEANTDVEERLAKLTLTNRTDGSTSVVCGTPRKRSPSTPTAMKRWNSASACADTRASARGVSDENWCGWPSTSRTVRLRSVGRLSITSPSSRISAALSSRKPSSRASSRLGMA